MEKELISVLVAAYNVERTIEKCLQSIVSQTYSRLEVVIVDDGSTDGTLEICNRFASMDPRFEVVHQENGGLSSARNTGLSMASGSLIAFVDGDDVLMPTMIERLYESLIGAGADISYCDWFRNEVDSGDAPSNIEVFDRSTFMPMILADGITSHAWNKLYKKEVWSNVEFPIGRVAQDMAVMHRVFNNAKKVVHISERLYIYFADNPENISNTNAKKINSSYDRAFALEDRYELAISEWPQVSSEVFTQLAGFKVSAYYKCVMKGDERRYELAEWINQHKGGIAKSTLASGKKILATVVDTPLESIACWLIGRVVKVK